METTVKEKATAVKAKKSVRKKHRLSELAGFLKGKIFYDDAIFNLGVRPTQR